MRALETLLCILCIASQALAWLPRHRKLFNDAYGATIPAQRNATSGMNGDGRRYPDLRRSSWVSKIRGVNLGSLFVMERWMASKEWSIMGCGRYKAESECVEGLGQATANRVFVQHWRSWITQDDLRTMKSYGLNTIRVPVGYWVNQQLVSHGEHFPQGAFPYLEQLCGWAADMQMYVILDLHAAPGAQKPNASFTGVIADDAGFYNQENYSRAYKFLSWMTQRLHTNPSFRTVGMLEVLNEPVPGHDSLTESYYPEALDAVRRQEEVLGVQQNDRLTVQMMDRRWGAGDPRSSLGGNVTGVAFDNHHYYFSKPGLKASRKDYLAMACETAGERDDTPLITGEWSLAVSNSNGNDFNPQSPNATDFYRQWWAGQASSYEKDEGWVFWTWRTDLNDYRWDYQKGVLAGVIPKDPLQAYTDSPCR